MSERFVVDNSLTSYDAAYLELAIRQGLPIASLDSKLLEAAKRVHVPVLDLELSSECHQSAVSLGGARGTPFAAK